MTAPKTRWLQFAGVFTIGLVWYALQPRGVGLLGVPAESIAHTGMLVFTLTFLLGDFLGASRNWSLPVQAVAALTVVWVSRGSVSPILVIIVVAQIAFDFPLKRAVPAVLAINTVFFLIAVLAWGLPATDALLTVLLFGSFHAFVMLLGGYARTLERARNRLREVNAELLATRSLLVESARDRERLRLSRELHDTAGHSLTALKLNLRTLAAGADGEQAQIAQQSLELADRILTDIRALVGNLRQTDGLAVDGAIRELTAPFSSPRFELNVEGDPLLPDLEAARVLVSVAREAITNVVRHAQAQNCVITLASADGGCRLTVEDDGRGMAEARFGHGLAGIRERLESVAGELSVQAREQGGTRLVAAIGGREQPC